MRRVLLTRRFFCCPTRFFVYRSRQGMTLIEIIVVMALLAGFLAVSAPFFKRKESSVKKMLRMFTALNRQLDSRARLKAKTYRLTFTIGEKSAWRVEKLTDLNKLPPITPPQDRSPRGEADTSNKPQLKPSLSPVGRKEFVRDESFFKVDQTLPFGLVFESISFSQKQKPISKGPAYIYYFPQGSFQKVLLKIKGKTRYWSLFFDRLTGDLDVFPDNKTWKDLTP